MKAKDLDKKFDEGKDISKYFDLSKMRHPKKEQQQNYLGPETLRARQNDF